MAAALFTVATSAVAALDAPVSPNALPQVGQLMQFMHGIQGQLILSGQQEIAWNQGRVNEDVNYILQQTGKSPAVRGFDFLDYLYSPSLRATQTASERAITWSQAGGIVTFCCHFFTDLGSPAGNPQFYTPGANGNATGTTFDIRQAVIAGTPENTEYLAKLDIIAAELKKLRDAGVPVIWRPFHECGGTWFWWSAHGPAPYIAAYRLMFTRFTVMHGLTNLIWVFNPIDSASTMQNWYPGDDVVDMISLDTYPNPGSNPSFATESKQMRDFKSDRKVIAMSENGSIPDPALLFSQGAVWSYFCTWNGFENDTTRNSVSFLNTVFNDPRVLTLDEVPAARAGKPVITLQPVATSGGVGGAASFTVSAFGTSLSYQWRKGGAALPGRIAATLDLANLQTSDAGSYDVVVTASGGPTTSSAVALTVTQQPGIGSQPVDQAVTTGFAVSFVARAGGTPAPTYKWQVSTNGTSWSDVANGGVYSGATTDTLKISGAEASMSGSRYRYVATNTAGSATSNAFTLNVVPARFPGPIGLARDSAGRLLVADGSNNTVQQVSNALVASLLAGSSGQQGATDATGAVALFRQPGGVAVAGDGVVFLADTGNSLVRRLGTGGETTTVAGSTAHQGFQDGTGTAAWFNAPEAIAVDSTGLLYVADTGNEVVRKIAAGGVVTTLAGTAGAKGYADATGATARFNHPGGLVLSTDGTILYVADTLNHTIRKIVTATGAVTTFVGIQGVSGSDDGSSATALFNNPRGLALDGAGNLYVADTGNSTVRKVTPAGQVSTVAGFPGVAGLTDGIGEDAWFNQPKGLAATADGTLYVADTGNATLRKISSDGTVTTLVFTAAPQFATQPADRSVTAGNSAVFTAAASAAPAPDYRWQRQTGTATTWADLSEGGAYSGTVTGSLTVSSTTVAMSGDRFRCVATNNAGAANSAAATLTVTAVSTGGSTGGNSGGGGGGALGLWFVAALGALGGLRRRQMVAA